MPEISYKEVLLTTFVLVLLPLLLLKSNFFVSTYVFEGQIKDALDGFAVDLTQIKSGNDLTFSDKDGNFELSISSKISPLTVLPTVDYETPKDSLSCQSISESWLNQRFSCRQVLFPQPFNVARRVLFGLNGVSNQTSEATRVTKEKLWSYLSSYSQKIWQNKDYFSDLMLPYEETNRRLKKLPQEFQVQKNYQGIRNYNYLGQDLSEQEVAVVDVSETLLNGQKRSRQLFFVKEKGLWKYLMPETPKEVVDFDEKNIWVFREK